MSGPIPYAVVPETGDAMRGDGVPVPQSHGILSTYMSVYPTNTRNPPHLFLEALSQAAAQRRHWTFLFTVAPLRVPGGTGSPANPIAMF